MFNSVSWQLKLRDESDFPLHIRSQFKLQPYGVRHIRQSPLVAHMPCYRWQVYSMNRISKLEGGNRERGPNADPFMSYMFQ